VNQRFATLHFPDRDPIGERIRLEPHGGDPRRSADTATEWTTIVGVAPDIPLYFEESVESKQSPMVYLPHRSEAQRFALLMLRTGDDPGKVTAVVRDLMREIEPDLPLYNIQTMDERLARNWEEYELFGSLFGAFGAIALVLSAVGVYAVTAYSVSQRLPEIAVRMALGAQPSQVRWLLLRSVLAQLALGLGIGLSGAFGLGKLLEGMLVGTHPTDLRTLLPVAMVLATVAVFACLGPARRATAVAPVDSLRSD
jgi:ABC-type antimicrobial peptide transport system permease subunit